MKAADHEIELTPDQLSRLAEYRQAMVVAEQKSQDDYDKTLVTLSGGALAISFAFLTDIVGPGSVVAPSLLAISWICWAASVAAVLVSYYLSRLALRKAIEQCDDRTIFDCPSPGARYAKGVRALNLGSGALFLIGVIAMSIFILWNTPAETQDDRPTRASNSIPAPTRAERPTRVPGSAPRAAPATTP